MMAIEVPIASFFQEFASECLSRSLLGPEVLIHLKAATTVCVSKTFQDISYHGTEAFATPQYVCFTWLPQFSRKNKSKGSKNPIFGLGLPPKFPNAKRRQPLRIAYRSLLKLNSNWFDVTRFNSFSSLCLACLNQPSGAPTTVCHVVTQIVKKDHTKVGSVCAILTKISFKLLKN